jgi:LysM repeat protein
MEYNHLNRGMEPAAGEKLYLKEEAPTRPLLADARRQEMQQQSIVKNTSQQETSYTTHVVQTKETLYAISKKYGVPMEKLKQWNNLVSYELRTGQELIIYKN